jgi:hypothetical protein
MKMRASNQTTGTGSTFQPCPAGTQTLVCCDVIDHGIIQVRAFSGDGTKPQHKVTIRWMSEHLMLDGRRYIVQKRYTLSSHKKSTLRRELEAWRGRPWSDKEADDFDIDTLIGVCALASVVHIPKPGRGTFAEVVALMPMARGMPKITIDPSYTRVPTRADGAPPTAADAEQPSEYDDSEPSEPPPDDKAPF